jgi:serine/threonine-protein kinase
MARETILNGRYALVAQQGSGGMSVIYKAIDRALGRTVAIKILRPSLTSDPSFLEKFRNEARAVANLSHPNIVTVYDVGSDGPTHYIVMEMIEGQDLKKLIKQHDTFSIERSLDIAIQICAGIGYAHRSGLVHADVKPQNILVTPQDVVKVTDFGIAQALSHTQPTQRAEIVWGSPHYFAPEQARGEQPAPQADVYAVGIVLFEMLTGQLPYIGTNQQELALAHIKEPIPNVSDINPAVPDRLSKIVYRAMSKDLRDRFRDGDQLGSVLRDFRERSREHTATNPNVDIPSPRVHDSKPVAQTTQPPGNRPPGIGSPPRINSDVTARYSSAPHAPEPYNPRQQASIPSPQGSITQPPQAFEQRFSPPMPPQQQAAYPPAQAYPPQIGDSGPYPPQYSRPMSVTHEEDEGIDYVTILLGILAVLAIGGLILLWIFVIANL